MINLKSPFGLKGITLSKVQTNKEIREHIAEVAETGRFIAQASACVAVFCQDTKYYLEDGCAATENILLELPWV